MCSRQVERREFVALIAGAVAGWPLTAPAQQRRKLPTIGFLGTSTPAGWTQWSAAFVQRLHELGWIEGRTVAIEYRWAESRPERFTEFAAEFAQLKVDVIFTAGTGIAAAKQATSAIPIVFALSNDPVGFGAVASLARPGGNVTGLSTQLADVAGRRIELMRTLIPGLHRLAIMVNPEFPDAVVEAREVRKVADKVGIEIATLEIRSAEDIARRFEGLRERADILFVSSDPLVIANRNLINSFALASRLPTMYGFREFVDAGGLVCYGPNVPSLFRRGAEFVDRVLRGAKPADIPVEQPTKFDLVLNLTTAKALRLAIPDNLLALADEVIEIVLMRSSSSPGQSYRARWGAR
jgi:putative ABC transport system substrate-binding protein